MDSNVRDVNGREVKVSERVEGKEVGIGAEREGESEKAALLPPRAGGMSKRPHKPGLKVQWNDKDGNKLVEVLEFQPSIKIVSDDTKESCDDSDIDDDNSDSCTCTIL